MYFVEMQNHIVRHVDRETNMITTITGNGRRGVAGDGGLATDAMLNQPHSIVLDENDGLYVADIGNHRIRRINLRTGVIESIAGNGERKPPKDGQPARGNPILGPRRDALTEIICGSPWRRPQHLANGFESRHSASYRGDG